MLLWASLIATAAATPPEPAALLGALRQAPPSQAEFFERRGSPLLEAPLQLRGMLERPIAGTLVKRVESPFREVTRIERERVVVEREAAPARRFSLRRAPELGALVASIEAVLGGEVALLERHFTLRMEGETAAWTMHLQPRDRRLAKRVTSLRFLGAGEELRCMDLVLAGAETSRTWLAGYAAAAAIAADDDARDALCHAPE